jgi:hypothetical protein
MQGFGLDSLFLTHLTMDIGTEAFMREMYAAQSLDRISIQR